MLDHAAHQRLHQEHHVLVVGVGLVGLQHGELRVVRAVHAFVPEVVPDLVDPLEATDQEALEVELVGDPQVERHVERVVVGHERPRRRTPIQRLQHGRLDLEEAALVQKGPDPAHGPRTEPEDGPDLRMHRQVGVALAVAELGILQTAEGHRACRPLLGLAARQWPERLGEQHEFCGAHGDLAGAGAEERPGDAQVVVQIELLHQLVALAELVAPEIDLDPAGDVLQMQERRLALRAQRRDPACHRHDGALLTHRIVIGRERACRRVRALVAVGEGGHPGRFERGALSPARRLDEAALLVVRGGHAALPPNRLR